VLLGDVVDELEDEHGLAHARAAEEADLAAAAVGGQQIDDLDAGLEHLDLDRLVHELGGGPVDGQELLVALTGAQPRRHGVATTLRDAA
jgi:hypothetical protein